jgi:hypothetical protein
VEGFGLDLDYRVAATFVVEDTEPSPGTPPAALGAAPDFGPDDAVNKDDPKQFILSTDMLLGRDERVAIKCQI